MTTTAGRPPPGRTAARAAETVRAGTVRAGTVLAETVQIETVQTETGQARAARSCACWPVGPGRMRSAGAGASVRRPTTDLGLAAAAPSAGAAVAAAESAAAVSAAAARDCGRRRLDRLGRGRLGRGGRRLRAARLARRGPDRRWACLARRGPGRPTQRRLTHSAHAAAGQARLWAPGRGRPTKHRPLTRRIQTRRERHCSPDLTSHPSRWLAPLFQLRRTQRRCVLAG